MRLSIPPPPNPDPNNYHIPKKRYHAIYYATLLNLLMWVGSFIVNCYDNYQHKQAISRVQDDLAIVLRENEVLKGRLGVCREQLFVSVESSCSSFENLKQRRSWRKSLEVGDEEYDVEVSDGGAGDVGGGGGLVPSSSHLQGFGDGGGCAAIVSERTSVTEEDDDGGRARETMKAGGAGCVMGYDGKCTAD
jgi:hypothetical protein